MLNQDQSDLPCGCFKVVIGLHLADRFDAVLLGNRFAGVGRATGVVFFSSVVVKCPRVLITALVQHT